MAVGLKMISFFIDSLQENIYSSYTISVSFSYLFKLQVYEQALWNHGFSAYFLTCNTTLKPCIYSDMWQMEVTVLTSNPTDFNRITQLLKVVVIQCICVEAPNLKWIYNTAIFLSLQHLLDRALNCGKE